jgi:hypothetical protein
MSKSTLPLAVLVAVALAAPVASAANWQDNSFHYWYGPNFAEPQIPFAPYGSANIPDATHIAKSVFTFTHASGYNYGGNFLNVDMLFSSPKDPVNNVTGAPNQGAFEVYVVYRHNLSLNAFLDKKEKPLEVGILRDVRIAFGADVNTKNTTFAPEKIMPIAGVEAAFAVPGFLTFGVFISREYNTNGFAVVGSNTDHPAVKFDPALQFDAAWHINLPLGALSFQGFGNVILPKGKDAQGNDTALEILLHPKFMYDVGTLWGDKGYEVGVGLQYWLNKFGNDHSKMPGCLETAYFGELAIHI